MKRDYKLFLQDIEDNIKRVKKFTKNVSFEEFKNDEEKTLAVTKALENIGEASINIPDEIKDKYKKIEWKEIKKFRNVLAHKYFGIDLKTEWEIIENELDNLKNNMEEVIKNEEEKDKEK